MDPSEDEKKDFKEAIQKATLETNEKTKNTLTELVELLERHGSIELMSQLVSLETRAQNPQFLDPENPSSENAFMLFLSGLFLKHHNLDAKAVHPNFTIYFCR